MDSFVVFAATCAGLALTCLNAAHGQTPVRDSARVGRDSVSVDSLLARLARAEAAIALLREQIAGEAESAVHARSRMRIQLSAQVLTNVFATYGRVNNVDVPQTALAPSSGGGAPPSEDALGITLRQTRFGAAASATDLMGATFSGDVDFDLFGGVQNGPGDRRLFPEPRLRTARGRVTWRHTEIMVGSDTPLISDLNPLSLAAVGVPDFSGAGNLWNWLGQLRVTQEIGGMGTRESQVRFALQGAVMSPYAAQLAPGELDAVDAGERSGRPAFEGRLRARWGDGDLTLSEALIGDRGGEIGVGAHRGWLVTGPSTLTESRAFSIDAHVIIVRGVEVRGEGYMGRLLRGLGGGAIAQNFGAPPPGAPVGTLGPPIRDVAGWAQLNAQPHPALIVGAGCGIDLPNPDDAPSRLQNTVCAAHADWRPVQPLVMGVEYRRLVTRFTSGTFVANHINLVFGFEL